MGAEPQCLAVRRLVFIQIKTFYSYAGVRIMFCDQILYCTRVKSKTELIYSEKTGGRFYAASFATALFAVTLTTLIGKNFYYEKTFFN